MSDSASSNRKRRPHRPSEDSDKSKKPKTSSRSRSRSRSTFHSSDSENSDDLDEFGRRLTGEEREKRSRARGKTRVKREKRSTSRERSKGRSKRHRSRSRERSRSRNRSRSRSRSRRLSKKTHRKKSRSRSPRRSSRRSRRRSPPRGLFKESKRREWREQRSRRDDGIPRSSSRSRTPPPMRPNKFMLANLLTETLINNRTKDEMQIAAAKTSYHQISKDRASDSSVRLMSEFLSNDEAIARKHRELVNMSAQDEYEEALERPQETYDDFKRRKAEERAELRRLQIEREEKQRTQRQLRELRAKRGKIGGGGGLFRVPGPVSMDAAMAVGASEKSNSPKDSQGEKSADSACASFLQRSADARSSASTAQDAVVEGHLVGSAADMEAASDVGTAADVKDDEIEARAEAQKFLDSLDADSDSDGSSSDDGDETNTNGVKKAEAASTSGTFPVSRFLRGSANSTDGRALEPDEPSSRPLPAFLKKTSTSAADIMARISRKSAAAAAAAGGEPAASGEPPVAPKTLSDCAPTLGGSPPAASPSGSSPSATSPSRTSSISEDATLMGDSRVSFSIQPKPTTKPAAGATLQEDRSGPVTSVTHDTPSDGPPTGVQRTEGAQEALFRDQPSSVPIPQAQYGQRVSSQVHHVDQSQVRHLDQGLAPRAPPTRQPNFVSPMPQAPPTRQQLPQAHAQQPQMFSTASLSADQFSAPSSHPAPPTRQQFPSVHTQQPQMFSTTSPNTDQFSSASSQQAPLHSTAHTHSHTSFSQTHAPPQGNTQGLYAQPPPPQGPPPSEDDRSPTHLHEPAASQPTTVMYTPEAPTHAAPVVRMPVSGGGLGQPSGGGLFSGVDFSAPKADVAENAHQRHGTLLNSSRLS